MTLAGAQDRPSRAGTMVVDDGSNEGGARVGAASRDPQSYPRRWYLSLILYFRGNERKVLSRGGGQRRAAGQHPKPLFSLLSHLPILCGGGGGGGGVAVEEVDEDDGGGRQRSTEEEWWQ